MNIALGGVITGRPGFFPRTSWRHILHIRGSVSLTLDIILSVKECLITEITR